MTGEEFLELYRNISLRQYVMDEAKKRNKLPQLQEEYAQEAWCLISCAPAGYGVEEYKELVNRAIYSAWWPTRREYLLARSMGQHVNASMCKTREKETDNEPWFMADEIDHDRRG